MIVSKKGSSTCTKTSFSYFTTTTKKCIFLSLSHAERDSFSNWNILLWKLYTTDRPPNAKLKLNEKSVRLHIIMATAFQIIIFLQLTIHLNLENLWTSFPLLLQFFSLSLNCEIFAMQHDGNQWISKKKRRLWTTAKKNSTCWWWTVESSSNCSLVPLFHWWQLPINRLLHKWSKTDFFVPRCLGHT